MQDPIARMLSELCTARGSLPSHYICVCLMHDSQRHGKCDLQSCMVVVNQVVNGQHAKPCKALASVGSIGSSLAAGYCIGLHCSTAHTCFKMFQ